MDHEEIKRGQERFRDNISELPMIAPSNMRSRARNETCADGNRVTGSDMILISRFRRAESHLGREIPLPRKERELKLLKRNTRRSVEERVSVQNTPGGRIRDER